MDSKAKTPEEMTLQPPPPTRGQPVHMPASQVHWRRRQRRASDVIDSGGLSPGGSPRAMLGSSLSNGAWHGPRSAPSPTAPAGNLLSPARDAPDAAPTNAATAQEMSVRSCEVPEAAMPVEKDAEEYYMGHPRRGYSIIFNNDTFNIMPFRSGSDVDVKNLERCFETLGFEVIIYHNKTCNEIANIIANLATDDHSDADCLVVTVLTHGMASGFLYAKDAPYPVHLLWEEFTADRCPSLAGKPKMFFIQACRGENLDAGVTLRRRSRTQTDSGSQAYKIPTHADFLLVYSTAEGFFSWRNPEHGTWFVDCLCKELAANAHSIDLLKILTRVSRRVALDYESFNDLVPWQHQCKQVPAFNSMLIRDVIFRPKV